MSSAGRPAKRAKSSASQDDAQKPDWISADDGMTTDSSRMSWKRPPMPTLDPSSDSIGESAACASSVSALLPL